MLYVLYNTIVSTGEFPEEWCNAVIVPIHKNSVADDPGNYRGIALLSCLGKIFTKILSVRLHV